MREVAAASRYARSLFELTEEKGVTESILVELCTIRDILGTRPELRALLGNPLLSLDEKRALVEGIVGSKVAPLTERFLILLVEKNRVDLLDSIVSELTAALNEKLGVEAAMVISARPLDRSVSASLEKALGKLTGKKVMCKFEIEPSLLGGIRVRIQNRLMDGSLKAKLQTLDQHLKQAKVF